MNISISKTHIIAIALFVAMGTMMFGSGVKGDDTHSIKQGGTAITSGVEHCHVVANISQGAVQKLTGDNTAKSISNGAAIETGIGGDDKSIVCVYSSIIRITNLLRIAVIIIVGVLFVYAGFLYATSSDNQESRNKAKTTIVAGVIGVFIALLATIMPSILQSIL